MDIQEPPPPIEINSQLRLRDAFQKTFISGIPPNQVEGGSWQIADPDFLYEKFSSRFQGGGGLTGAEFEFQIS